MRRAAILLLVLAGCQSAELTSVKVHYQTGRHDLAVDAGKRALTEEPGNAEIHFYLALAYVALDEPAGAYAHFAATKSLDPSRADIVDRNIASTFATYYNQGLRFIQTGNADAARHSFEQAQRSSPADGRAPYQLGRLAFEAGDTAGALRQFDIAMSQLALAEATYNSALSMSAHAHRARGEIDAMVGDLRWLLKNTPERYADAEVIGFEELEAENWSLAADVLALSADARRRVNADDFYIYFNLGVAHYQSGKRSATAAVDAFESALELRPDDPHTRLALARACLLAQDWEAAVRHGERYARMQPDDGDVWRVLANAYGALGDREKARRCSIRYEELATE